MKTLILGPTFVLRVAAPPEVVADRLGEWIGQPTCPFAGHRQGLHLQLAVLPGERHRWSPWLTIEVREPLVEVPMPTLPAVVVGGENGAGGGGGGEAEVFGRFNPSPAIWTLYVLVSMTLIAIGAAAAMWGVAQVIMEDQPTAIWGVAACLFVLVAMWSVSAAGQRLAGDEMNAMREAVGQAIGDEGSGSGEPRRMEDAG